MNNEENIKEMAIATILDIYSCIDWDKIDTRRAYGIWDEITDKIRASAMTTNSYEVFVDKLCKKLGIRSLKYNNVLKISREDVSTKKEILKLMRNEIQYIILEVRFKKEVLKEMKNMEDEKDV